MSARDEILSRVREAVADVTTAPGARGPVPVIEVASPGAVASLELFSENVADYRAEVVRVGASGVGDAVAQALRDHGCRSVVVPTGLDPLWRNAIEASFEVVGEAEATSAVALDQLDAVVTGSVAGIATTGTIVLDHGPGQGRHELSLIPDTHVCVIRTDQVVHDVPEAVSRLRRWAPRPGHSPGSAGRASRATSSSSGPRACTGRARWSSSSWTPTRERGDVHPRRPG